MSLQVHITVPWSWRDMTLCELEELLEKIEDSSIKMLLLMLDMREEVNRRKESRD